MNLMQPDTLFPIVENLLKKHNLYNPSQQWKAIPNPDSIVYIDQPKPKHQVGIKRLSDTRFVFYYDISKSATNPFVGYDHKLSLMVDENGKSITTS